MVRQPFDLLGHPVPDERLKGLDDAGMQHPPPLLQETPVGHLVREGVLEGVGMFWEEAGLVEEFRRLEVRQAPVQYRLGHLGNGLQQGQGDLRANNGSGLEKMFLLRRQAVDTRRQDGLHRGGYRQRRESVGEPIRTALAHQDVGLDQGAHTLFQEKRIACGALAQ